MNQSQFNNGANSAVATRTNSMLSRVFFLMFLGLTMTAIIAYVLGTNQEVVQALLQNSGVFWGIWVVQLVLVFGLSALINRINSFVANIAFFLYAAVTGVSFSVLMVFFSLDSIAGAFFITAGMFGISALIGYTTKMDLSRIGFFALMLVLGLILASLVNIFFLKSGMIELIISYAMVILFTIVTAFDMQNIKHMSQMNLDEETLNKYAIYGALMLYIDFIMIFRNLLTILNDD
ncbi:Bax inhibitor-1 family protein [Laceyella putida]|jgi:FtsH-binding integral membrane protein|uniref:Bax inhibitor-1 family protein n=1 Tax=Laceyella putida TaxID=110101 RepID=A0ABW2RKW4_9BACL